jgi:hypothetical protein
MAVDDLVEIQTQPIPEHDLKTMKEAAAYIRKTRQFLWGRDDIPYYRVGNRRLYDRHDLDLFLERNKHGKGATAA